MLILLSPAKTQQFIQSRIENISPSPFLDESEEIIESVRKLDTDAIKILMKVSDTIAEQTVQQFQQWNRDGNDIDSTAAISGFSGPAFKALDSLTLTDEAVERAKKSLIILSGLYGVLHADSRLMPYRLEMGLSFKPDGKRSLYSFWKEKITSYLNSCIENEKFPAMINLASNEYAKAIDFKSISVPVITCDFKERKGDVLRSVSSYAKTARGTMARYILTNGICSPDELKSYSEDGYAFSEEHSTDSAWCFIR